MTQKAETRKKAVVTGASSGIGAVYADRLAKRGYDLILVARRRDRLEAVADSVRKASQRNVEIIQADLSRPDSLVDLEDTLRSDPDIHLLVNNAGLGQMSGFLSTSLETLQDMIAVNVTSPVRLTHTLLPEMLKRGEGAIINIASVLAIHSLPITGAYSGTKSFLTSFTRGLQQELSGTGVRAQLVLPASTATEIWENSGLPLSNLDPASVMTPENLVDAALAGFDQGEDVTWPSVHDTGLWDAYDTARQALFNATQTGQPAPRYLKG